MIQQTVFPFKMEMTEEKLTAQGGLVLMAEFNHGIGLRELTDQFCCLKTEECCKSRMAFF